MNRFVQSLIICSAVGALIGCNQQSDAKQPDQSGPLNLVTTADSVSYMIGKDIGRSLKDVQDEVVLDIVFRGTKEYLAGTAKDFNPDAERMIMQAFQMRMQQKKMAENDKVAAENLEKANKFLEENKKKEGVKTTKSGLQYIVLKEGNGPIPTDSSKVEVHYEGTLLNGKVFDSSIKRGKPAVFNVKQVIKGWTEILQMMKVGSKYKIFVPPDLAYGKRGMAHDIKPNMMLIFEIELISIKSPEKQSGHAAKH